MNERDEKIKISLEQDKWALSSIISVSVAFFLALLSSSKKLDESSFLLFSAICFAIEIPLSIILLSISLDIGWKMDKSTVLPFYNSKSYDTFSTISVGFVCFAILSLLFHFSVMVGISMLLSLIVVTLVICCTNK